MSFDQSEAADDADIDTDSKEFITLFRSMSHGQRALFIRALTVFHLTEAPNGPVLATLAAVHPTGTKTPPE